jgi:membrane protease YdiL (CAAX protease family)
VRHPNLVAFLGGATISLAPSWLITQLAARFPSIAPEELTTVTDFFSNGIGPLQLVVLSLIVIFIPILEEYIFRGFLWQLISKFFTPNVTLVIISIVFALIHGELLHILGLLPISFFLGWLRLKTGEVGPSILAHMTNNLVACILMLL